jgi:RNA polymerase subunit RPABC4/transcription elongation factor Spt4
MEHNTVYPDWVQKYRGKGMTVKEKNGCYYLYKRTSKRIPGKKYPQPVDTYIGVITKDGIVYAEKKMIPTDPDLCEVKEFGFSNALLRSCPESWKTSIGKNWKEILMIMIVRASENSYLAHEYKIPDSQEYRVAYNSQFNMLYRKIHAAYGVDKQMLERLKFIYIVYFGKNKFISRIDEEQKDILKKLGIEKLEVA